MARDFDALMAGDDDGAGLRAALRFVAWGGVAASAIAVAVLAARTDDGAQRLARLVSGPATAAAESPKSQTATALAARLAETESEALRLNDTVRRLTADRELVIARLEALERSMDTTASIRESAPAAMPAGTAPATPAATPPPVAPAAAPAPSAQAAPLPATPAQAMPAPAASILAPDPLIPATASPTPLPQATGAVPVRIAKTIPSPAPAGAEQTNLGAIAGPAADSVATRTEFGVDLGGDRTVDALRSLWNALRTGKQGVLFEGLRPVVAVRDGGKPGSVELRLVVGPLANAGAAARLCGSAAAVGLACQPTVFDGQRLAVR